MAVAPLCFSGSPGPRRFHRATIVAGLLMAFTITSGVARASGSVSIPVSSLALGDMNGDGLLDLPDVLRLRDISLSLGIPASPDEEAEGDLDGDGAITAADVDALTDVLLGRRAVPHAIPPEGGAMVLESPAGATVTLNFPPPPWGRSTIVGARVVEPVAGSGVTVEFGPTPLYSFDPVEIVIEAPPGFTVTEETMIVLGDPSAPVILSTTRNTGTGVVTATAPVLGLNPTEWAALPWPEGLGPSALESLPFGLLSSPDSCFYTPQLNLTNVTCQQVIDSSQEALNRLVKDRNPLCALRLQLGIGAVTQFVGCDYTGWLTGVESAACAGYADAVNAAQATVSLDETTLYAQAGRIIEWESIVELLGATCPGQPDFMTVIRDEFIEYAQWFEIQADTVVTQSDFERYETLLEAFRRGLSLHADTELLGLDAAADTIAERVIKPTLDRLREAAYDVCANHQDHRFLSRLYLYESVYGILSYVSSITGDQLLEDIQYCATAASVETETELGNAAGLSLLGGTDPGIKQDSDSLAADVDGTVTLAGDVFNLSCEGLIGVVLYADDELLVRFDGQQIGGAIQPDPERRFFPSPIVLDVDTDIEQALGITLAPGDVRELAVYRLRPPYPCRDGVVGSAFTKLYSVDLHFDETALLAEVTFPTSVQQNQPTPLTVRAVLHEPQGETYLSGVSVSVAATGGTAVPTGGVTDGSGTFVTSVTPTSDPLELVIDLTGPGGLTVSDTVTATVVAPIADAVPTRRYSSVAAVASGCSDSQALPFDSTDYTEFDATATCTGVTSHQLSTVGLSGGKLLGSTGEITNTAAAFTNATSHFELDFTVQSGSPTFAFDSNLSQAVGGLLGGGSFRISLTSGLTPVFYYDSEGAPPPATYSQGGQLAPGDYTLEITVEFTADATQTVDWDFQLTP